MDSRAIARRRLVSVLGVAAGLTAAGAVAYAVARELHIVYFAHAGAMLAAWGVLLPLGAMVARYGKVTRDQDFPRELDNKFWWTWHRAAQYYGAALMTIGFLAIVSTSGGGFGSLHGQLGLGALILGWLQVLTGLLRGSKGGPTEPALAGDHYDMTARRRLFEGLHKSLGWIAIALGAAAIQTGLLLLASPVLIQAVAGAWFVGLAFVAWRLERSGRRIDTYTAIWGPDSLRRTCRFPPN